MVWLPCAVHVCRASLPYAVYPPKKEFACVSAKYLKSINYLANPARSRYFKIVLKSLNTLAVVFSCVVVGRSCGQSSTPDLRLVPVLSWHFSTVYVFLLTTTSLVNRDFLSCSVRRERVIESAPQLTQVRCTHSRVWWSAPSCQIEFSFFRRESAGRLFGTH